MPQITQAWVNSLDRSQFEKVAALGLYYRRAMLLFIHADEWFHAHFAVGRTLKQQREIFDEFFFPYYSMWTSMVYVVDEGFGELNIEDVRLQNARTAIDMDLLRRFRNGTFHYQPHFRSPKHNDLIMSKGFGSARALHERHGVLVRRLGRFLVKSPDRGWIL